METKIRILIFEIKLNCWQPIFLQHTCWFFTTLVDYSQTWSRSFSWQTIVTALLLIFGIVLVDHLIDCVHEYSFLFPHNCILIYLLLCLRASFATSCCLPQSSRSHDLSYHQVSWAVGSSMLVLIVCSLSLTSLLWWWWLLYTSA